VFLIVNLFCNNSFFYFFIDTAICNQIPDSGCAVARLYRVNLIPYYMIQSCGSGILSPDNDYIFRNETKHVLSLYFCLLLTVDRRLFLHLHFYLKLYRTCINLIGTYYAYHSSYTFVYTIIELKWYYAACRSPFELHFAPYVVVLYY